MKFIRYVALFLLMFGLVSSDPFLVSLNPNLTQSLFALPFLMYSFLNYRFNLSEPFVRYIFTYIGLVFLFFVFSGFEDFTLFTNLAGTALVGFAVYNQNVRRLVYTSGVRLFIIGTTFISIAFYFGQWDISFVGRATFIQHNENTLSQLLNIGFALAAYKYCNASARREKRVYFIASALHVVPVLATVSRTGIILLFVSIIIFTYYRLAKKWRTVVFLYATIFAVATSAFLSVLITRNLYLQQFVERTSAAKDDDRAKLWDIAFDVAAENWITGIGFGTFNDFNWRKSVGLVVVISDDSQGINEENALSIHNSFLDLALIGGVWLVLIFAAFMFYLARKSIAMMRNSSQAMKLNGALVFVLMFNCFIFSFTGQGATQKALWFLFGLTFGLIDTLRKEGKLKA